MSPRPPVERVARSIRLRKEADEELVRRAEAAGLSVNAFLDGLFSPGEHEASVVVPRRDYVPIVGGKLQTSGRLIPMRHSCSHPRKSRQVFSWGAKCGDCGKRL